MFCYFCDVVYSEMCIKKKKTKRKGEVENLHPIVGYKPYLRSGRVDLEIQM